MSYEILGFVETVGADPASKGWSGGWGWPAGFVPYYDPYWNRPPEPNFVMIGAEVGLTDRASVQKFQGGIISLVRDKSRPVVPEFVALYKAIQKKDGGFGKFGPVTHRAAAKFNEIFNTGGGSNITQATLDVLTSVTAVLSPAEVARQATDEKAQEKIQAERAAKQAEDAKKAQAIAAAATTPTEVQAAAAQNIKAAANADSEVKAKADQAAANAAEAHRVHDAAVTPAERAEAKVKVEAARQEVHAVAVDLERRAKGGSTLPVAFVLIAGGFAVAGLGATVALALKAKWVWAGLTFFLFTPVAVGAAGAVGYAVLANEQQKRLSA